MDPSRRPWIVKLGGSLHDSPNLRRWLAVIAAAKAPVVIVPGGGPFADSVRLAQARLKFSDAVAHHMALLAMEQYGLAMIGVARKLRATRTKREIAASLRAGAIPVWFPAKMTLGRPDIAESWEVTSDSLALWLAQRLRARGLLLVKAARLPHGSRKSRALAKAGIIDDAFPRMLARSSPPCWCIGARRYAEAARVFRMGGDPRATGIEPG
ncbi:MAG TPA: hypothetical protein VH835_11195 [Dongiaceae bacterium]